MDAYDFSNEMKRLWVEHVDKNSGLLNKENVPLKLYSKSPYGVYELTDIYYDPEFGIMVEARIETYGKKD